MKKHVRLWAGIVTAIAIILFGIELMLSPMRANVAAWGMWAVLDTLMVLVTHRARKKEDPFPFLAAGCAVGSSIVTAALLLHGTWQWGHIETIALIGAIAATIIWLKKGNEAGVLAFVAAINIAGMPQLFSAFNGDAGTGLWLWIVCACACTLTLIAKQGKWTMHNDLFSSAGIVYNGLMIAGILLNMHIN